MKHLKTENGDVIRITRGEEVIEVTQGLMVSGKRRVGVQADRDWRIELLRDGVKVEAVGKRSPLNPENWNESCSNENT